MKKTLLTLLLILAFSLIKAQDVIYTDSIMTFCTDVPAQVFPGRIKTTFGADKVIFQNLYTGITDSISVSPLKGTSVAMDGKGLFYIYDGRVGKDSLVFKVLIVNGKIHSYGFGKNGCFMVFGSIKEPVIKEKEKNQL